MIKILNLGLLLLIVNFGCKRIPTAEETLLLATAKIEASAMLGYKYVANWDTRINASTFIDSTTIIYFKASDSHHGYGFYADGGDTEFIYDGFHYRTIMHADQTVINEDPNEVAQDSAYFADKLFFAYSPLDLLAVKLGKTAQDTLIDGQLHYIFSKAEERPSYVDETKKVRSEYAYFIDAATSLLKQIKNTTIIAGDTAQVIDYHFTDYTFQKTPYELSEVVWKRSKGYQEISSVDYEEERHLAQIAPGDQLEATTYTSIDGEPQVLFGDPSKKSLIMFSFIGCTGCELALQELSKRDYEIRDSIQLFYSSPQNHGEALKSYLAKHEFPFTAFGSASGVQQDFLVYTFPTFVLVNAAGGVEQVITGYDESVEALLYR